MSIDFVWHALRAISTFTYNVGLPFLNFCEKGKQIDFIKILPKLLADLENHNLDTLREYKVEFSFNLHHDQTLIESRLLEKFCERTSKCLIDQKGREYGLVENPKPRATQLNLLSESELEGLPTNNILSERNLAMFDKEMIAFGRNTNKNFKAKGNVFFYINFKSTNNCLSEFPLFLSLGIKDNMTLLYCDYDQIHVDRTVKNMKLVLDDQEQRFIEIQKEIMEDKIRSHVTAAEKLEERSNNLLKKCKTWGGPWTEFSEFKSAVSRMKDEVELKKIIRNEILFKKVTCPRDFEKRKALYKVNKMSLAEMKANMTILLSTEQLNPDFISPDESTILAKISQAVL